MKPLRPEQLNKNDDEFLALQAKWYGKLKKSGFKDAEQDEDHLKVWSSRLFNGTVNGQQFTQKRSYYESREDYYRLAGWFLNEYPFKTPKDKLIWQLHSEGISIRNIILILKKKHFKVHVRMVHPLLKELTKTMIDQYTKEQYE